MLLFFGFLFYPISVHNCFAWLLDLLNLLVSCTCAFFLVQLITTKRLPFYLPKKKVIANYLCCAFVITAFWLLTASVKWAGLIGSILLLVLATIDYYVFRFKGTEFSATDFFAAKTAFNVVGHYNLKPEKHVVFSWFLWLCFLLGQLMLPFIDIRNAWLIRAAAGVVFCFSVLVFLYGTKGVRETHWFDAGAQQYGYILNFMLGIKGLFALKPKDYNTQKVDELSAQYSSTESPKCQTTHRPDIIVIMNESFVDFSVLGREPNTNKPVLPIFRSIQKNAITGYALASVFGGSTPNSEYEFLTGNSMAFFPYGSIPFQQYVHGKAYSLVSELKDFGYQCMATHPYLASGWSRPTVYPAFGFDQITFIEAYPKQDTPRGYVSDSEMYDYITEQYEKLSKSGNVFLYGVTMQNHGDYAGRSKMIDNTIVLNHQEKAYPDVDQYLSLLRLSDQALEKLISYFSSVNREVILCFFGDHFPSVNWSFLEELHGNRFDSLDSQQLTKKVPFFIWANFPIQKQEFSCTSLNYLATHLLEAAGLPLPPYRQFLKKTAQLIPSINADGFYSFSNQKYQTFQEAAGKEAETLRNYRILVYNNAIDRKHADSRLFSC